MTTGDMANFKKIQNELTDTNERCTQQVLNELFAKLNIEEKVFEDSLKHYMEEDPKQAEQIKEIMSLSQEAMMELKRKWMPKAEENHKILKDLSLDAVKKLD